jgi:hypothetical protein
MLGQEPTPSKVNPIIETAIKKIYLTAEQPDVAAVIEEVQLKCFNAKTETSSAADPATDFCHSQIMCFRSHSICAEQPIFANNLRLYSSLPMVSSGRSGGGNQCSRPKVFSFVLTNRTILTLSCLHPKVDPCFGGNVVTGGSA